MLKVETMKPKAYVETLPPRSAQLKTQRLCRDYLGSWIVLDFNQ